jgi:hypothetical protein
MKTSEIVKWYYKQVRLGFSKGEIEHRFNALQIAINKYPQWFRHEV